MTDYREMDDGELFREWLCLCNLYVFVSGEGDNRERPMFERLKTPSKPLTSENHWCRGGGSNP